MSEKLSQFSNKLSPERRKLLHLMLQEKRRKKASANGDKPQEAIPRRDPSLLPPLSFAQQRLWFIQQLQPENAAYNIPSAVRLTGRLDEALFEGALNRTIQRHESLRTTFVLKEGQPVLQIASRWRVRLPLVDLERLSPQQRESQTQKMVDRLSRTPLELAKTPPWQAALYRLTAQNHVFQVVLHHIISDTWTTGVFFREMAGHYQAMTQDRPSPLPELPVQYADYAIWQRSALKEDSRRRQIEYWKRRFEGALPLLPLPSDRPRPPLQSFRGGRVFLNLPPRLTGPIKDLSASCNATLFMTLMAAYQTLLFRYTGETDILVGTPMANRNRVELEDLVGLFVNTLVIRSSGFRHNPPFTELLAQLREATLEGLSNHEVPFERVVDELNVERDTSRNPVFQALFAFQNVPIPQLVAEGLTLKRYEFRETTARLDLELDMQEMPSGFVGWIGYNADLFDHTTVQRMARNYEVLLSSIVKRPETRVGELPLMTPAERHHLLISCNDTEADVAAEATLTELFADQVGSSPDGVAVVGEGGVQGPRSKVQSQERESQIAVRSSGTRNLEPGTSASSKTLDLGPWTLDSALPSHLSFTELERRSKQLAARLNLSGVGPDSLVGLCLGRCPEAVTGILGILRAGGGYLPLDEKFPLQRLSYILQEAQAPFVVTWKALAERLPEGADKVFLDEVDETEGSGWRPPPIHPYNLAYALYTSGSTGKPKGVLVPHRPAVHLMAALRRLVEPGRTSPQRASLNAPLVFDPSVQQWVELLWGNCLATVHDEARLDAQEFLRLMERQSMDVVDCTPTQLQAWVDAGLLERPQARGMTFLVGGEPLPRRLCQRLADSLQVRVYNVYGTSECAVDDTSCRISAHLPEPLLGYPISNSRIHLLNRRAEPVPLGAVGELCIAGQGPGRGYLGRPARTALSFCPDPWSPRPGGRLYRTGDLARRRSDGRLEFQGRNDFQVKVRGYRIELGEVEAALAGMPQVEDAVVVARDGRLIGYVVGGEGEGEEGRNRRERGGRTQRDAEKSSQRPLRPLSATSAVDSPSLRNLLQAQLPEYMVPSLIIELDALPLTPNGKVDRSALPEPDSRRPSLQAEFVAPQSDLEQSIAEIWKKVLGLDDVGLNDNFFDLGGHSMLLTQVHKELQELAPQLTLVDLFKYPTIGALTGFLSGESGLSQLDQSRQRAAARQQASQSSQSDVAIIGAALRVPGANTPDQLWENLVQGVESISFFSRQEVLEAGVSPEAVDHPDYVRAEGVIDHIDEFDPDFFGYPDEEVEMIDPQQRIFLELAWEGLEQAGYDPETYPGNIGVFAGQNISSYLFSNLYDFDPFNVMSQFLTRVVLLTGNAPDYLPARVSYHLKLRGPSVGVQTACSTALVAAHTACQSLLRQECDMALAGGVQLRVPQKMGYRYQEGGFPSPDGHCRSFDARAKGTVHGNGAGLVLLKRLADAQRDGDHVWAVIRGSAVTNDAGLKVGFTAPSVEGQARACAEALAVSQVDPDSIGYLEASGTGTEMGDPIEIEALTQAFRSSGVETRGTVPIGSIKSNIGHLDAASGAASLIKAALSLRREKIPASLHFEKPNPNIDFAGSPFFVNSQLRDWPRAATPRRASVHSYAVGGTNAHLVLEEAPPAKSTPSPRSCHLLLLSARTSTALHRLTLDLADYLKRHPEFELADVAYTLQVGRRLFPFRRALLCSSREEAVQALRNLDPERVWTGFGDSSAAGQKLMPAAAGEQSDAEQMKELAQQWLSGASIDWGAFYAAEKRLRVPLPTYPFERRRIWAQPKISQEEALWRKASSGRRLEIDDWFYTPSWQRSEQLEQAGDPAWQQREFWLIVDGNAEGSDSLLGTGLIDKLSERDQDVVHVRPAAQYRKISTTEYHLHPARREEWAALVDDLAAAGRRPRRAVHLRSLQSDADGATESNGIPLNGQAQDDCFWSLLHLSQALVRPDQDPVQLEVVTSGLQEVTGEEELIPLRSMSLAALRVIPQEFPSLRCRCIDLSAALLQSAQAEAAAALLMNEMSLPSTPVVAYRGSRRWIQTFQRLGIQGDESANRLRRKGVYLITGGASPFSLLTAEYLASSVQARLVLSGKWGLPPQSQWDEVTEQDPEAFRRIAQLRRLEKQGAEVALCDSGPNGSQPLQKAVDEAIRRFGNLHGVVYAGGESSLEFARSIADLDREFFEQRLQARLGGLAALQEALEGRQLDFCLLASTVASLLGGWGLAAECAADNYLDAFARSRRSPWLSVNFDAFRPPDAEAAPAGLQQAHAIRSHETGDLFDRLLSLRGPSQLVVSTTDLEARLQKVQQGSADDKTEEEEERRLKKRPELEVPFTEPRNDLERRIAETWAEVMGYEQLGVRDNFFDLGGNSLMATQLLSRLRDRFEVNLSLKDFFEGGTVASVAEGIEVIRWATEGQVSQAASEDEEFGEI